MVSPFYDASGFKRNKFFCVSLPKQTKSDVMVVFIRMMNRSLKKKAKPKASFHFFESILIWFVTKSVHGRFFIILPVKKKRSPVAFKRFFFGKKCNVPHDFQSSCTVQKVNDIDFLSVYHSDLNENVTFSAFFGTIYLADN